MDENRRSVYATLNEEFRRQNLSLSQIGRDIATPSVDPSTGTWSDRGFYAKTPRFLVQFRINADGTLEAGQFQINATWGKLGYINTSNSNNKVAGIFIRVLPIFCWPDRNFEAVTHWEWTLMLTFTVPISGGGSSDSLDNFNPPSTTINWNSRGNTKTIKIGYASLFDLSPTNPNYTYAQGTDHEQIITYDEAGKALAQYLSFDFIEDISPSNQ